MIGNFYPNMAHLPDQDNYPTKMFSLLCRFSMSDCSWNFNLVCLLLVFPLWLSPPESETGIFSFDTLFYFQSFLLLLCTFILVHCHYPLLLHFHWAFIFSGVSDYYFFFHLLFKLPIDSSSHGHFDSSTLTLSISYYTPFELPSSPLTSIPYISAYTLHCLTGTVGVFDNLVSLKGKKNLSDYMKILDRLFLAWI